MPTDKKLDEIAATTTIGDDDLLYIAQSDGIGGFVSKHITGASLLTVLSDVNITPTTHTDTYTPGVSVPNTVEFTFNTAGKSVGELSLYGLTAGNARKVYADVRYPADINKNTAITTTDGVSITNTTRVLFANLSPNTDNGIYTDVNTTSWQRVSDYDVDSEIRGSYVGILYGTTYAGKFLSNTNASAITVGTTGITFDDTPPDITGSYIIQITNSLNQPLYFTTRTVTGSALHTRPHDDIEMFRTPTHINIQIPVNFPTSYYTTQPSAGISGYGVGVAVPTDVSNVFHYTGGGVETAYQIFGGEFSNTDKSPGTRLYPVGYSISTSPIFATFARANASATPNSLTAHTQWAIDGILKVKLTAFNTVGHTTFPVTGQLFIQSAAATLKIIE